MKWEGGIKELLWQNTVQCAQEKSCVVSGLH